MDEDSRHRLRWDAEDRAGVVRSGSLAATIYIRPNTDLAIEMLVEAFKNGGMLPDRKVTEPESIPSLTKLAAAGKMARAAKV